MKKNTIFKVLLIIMVVLILLTWFIPAGYFQGEYIQDEIYRLGFFDFCQYLVLPFFQSMFLEVLIFLVAVGAFYGVLSKTGAYRALLEKIAKKIEKKGTLFLIIISFVIAALSSFGGYGLLMFIFIPAIISIILLMGYDKLTALLVTFLSMLIGTIGTTYGASYIGQTLTTLGLDYNSEIYFKLGLFVLSFVIFILFTLSHARKAKKIKNAKDTEDLYLGEKTATKKTKPCAIIVVFSLLFVLLILGATAWGDALGVKLFSTIHNSITAFTIADYPIFSYILGGAISEFGSWSYFQYSIMLVLASLLLGKIYKFKFSEIFETMINGIKHIIKPALLVVFAYGILILIANTGLFSTLMSYILAGAEKFSLFTTSLITIVGSALHIELSYVGSFFLSQLVSPFTAEYASAMLNVMTQSLYGLTMFVAPTSLFLILGLTYLDIPYKKWLKFSWKLVLELFIVIVIALVVMLLILK